MTRLEKEALGKQVVSMRPTVKRAKLWLVHNLVRQAKRLKEKKGTDTQKAKLARRAERCLQEINIIKQISEDEVSKFALCNKNPTGAMKQAESLPVDQRALIRLATCKPVQERVTAFREAFPDSIERTILLTKALGLKYQKRREKLKQIQTTKTTKASDSPSEKPDEECELASGSDNLSDESNKSDKQEDSEEQPKQAKPPKTRIATPKSTAKTQISNTTTAKENIQSSVADTKSAKLSSEVVESKPAEKIVKKNKVTVAWPSLPVPIAEKREGTVEIRRLNLSEWQDEDQLPVKSSEDKPEKEVGYTPSSSFFLGGKSDSESEDNEDGEQNNSFKRKFQDRKSNNRNGSFHRDNSEWSRKPPTKKAKAGPQRSHNPQKIQEREAPPPAPVENEKLHPSWAAKRAHKPTVTEFQGKKITFDD